MYDRISKESRARRRNTTHRRDLRELACRSRESNGSRYCPRVLLGRRSLPGDGSHSVGRARGVTSVGEWAVGGTVPGDVFDGESVGGVRGSLVVTVDDFDVF